jgi:hypothetical protein
MDQSSPSNFDLLMSQVGHTLHFWNQVESAMGLLFTISSGISDPLKAGALFDAVIAFEARIAVLGATISHQSVLGDTEKKIWSCLSAKLRKLYRKRHEVAHFSLLPEDMLSGEGIRPYFTWNKHARQSAKYLTKPQLYERGQRFNQASQAVMWFVAEMRTRTPPVAAPQLPNPEPQMIAHIRELLARSQQAQTEQPSA